MFGSMRADIGYPLGVIRPVRLAPRPLSGLAELLGVGRSESIRSGIGILSGVTLDSRAVQPGDLYAALPGTRTHGAAYSDQAVAAGAVAILTDPDGRDRAARTGVPVFVVSNPRERLGDVSCWIYGDPSHRMTMIGVTGTSGKTTTSYLCEAGLRAAGHATGLVGGVEIKIGPELAAASLTTPEAPDLQALLAIMAERGVTAVAMEVSSHSLALGRVAGTRYGVAVFTNLSQDHLDFHAGFEDYFRAKAKLFTPAYSAVGVVNVADRYGRRLVAEAAVPVTTFCADAASGAYAQAEWRAADVRCGADGSTFRVIGPGGVEADASVTLPGPFNVANALGAIVALVESGVDLADAVERRGLLPRRARPPPARAVVPRGDDPPYPRAVVRLRPYLPGIRSGAARRVRRLLAQARRGRGGTRGASPGDKRGTDRGTRLRRGQGPRQAAADGRRRGQARRRGDLYQRQPAFRGPAWDPRRDAARGARGPPGGAGPADHRAGPGRGD